MGQSVEEINLKLQAGDRKTFEKLFRDHYKELCFFANKYVHEPEIAEEMVQDLFVRLWEKRENLVFNSSVKSYLFTSLRNACLNFIKHRKVEEKYQEYAAREMRDATLRQETYLREPGFEEKVFEAIENLPPQCRLVFKMSRIEGLKYREIADKLNVSIKTVENQIGRALKILREDLSDFLSIFIILLFL